MIQISKKGICIALLVFMAITPFSTFADLIVSYPDFVNFYLDKDEETYGGRVRVEELISERVPLERLAEVLSDPVYRSRTKVLVDYGL